MDYFKGIKTLKELKATYKDLCKKYHPDINVYMNDSFIKEINFQYEKMLSQVTKYNNYTKENEEMSLNDIEVEKEIKDIILKTLNLKGLDVELCGNWIWFTGETRTHKDILKGLGCYFAAKKKAWYWRPADYKRKGKKTLSLNEIRETHGSKKFTRNLALSA